MKSTNKSENFFLSHEIARLVLVLALVAMGSGCAVWRSGQPVYVESEEVTPIEVPEGMTPPPVRSTYEIPGYYLPQLAAEEESRPPRVPTSAEAERAQSRIRFGPTGLYLEVDDEPASVWRRLGFTLNRSGMSVVEVRESERRFQVQFEHEPIVEEVGFFRRTVLFWRSPEVTDYSGQYLIEVQPESDQRTRVAILDSQGDVVRLERAEFVLSQLRDRLG